jgi:hypothetical protein
MYSRIQEGLQHRVVSWESRKVICSVTDGTIVFSHKRQNPKFTPASNGTRITMSAHGRATGWTVDVPFPAGSWHLSFSRYRPDELWGLPSLLYNRYRDSFPEAKLAGAWNWSLTSNWSRLQEHCSSNYSFRCLIKHRVKFTVLFYPCNDCHIYKKQTPWPESASELYRPSDHRVSAKLVPTFADSVCHVVSATNPYGRNLDFLDRSRYFFFQV